MGTTRSIDPAAELQHLRFVEANLRARVAELEAEVGRLRQADWVVWDLWCRDVRPGWRMWRIKRRHEVTQAMSAADLLGIGAS